ncbi:MAG: PTS fructose transporter subunit IIC [Erysipelotrichaceae bacterium]|nr:PTS fructose transporter subunit IIC [Erysipelotrichaceae bacterium]
MKLNITTIKKHVMTGISFMIPVVVASGLCQALGILIGGPGIKEASSGIIWMIYKIGNLGLSTLIVPVICAAISYSICDRPGIAPGLIVGLVCAEIKAGFLGGVVAAFLIGFVVNWMKQNLKLPETMKGMMPILIIPFFSTLICGLLMFTVVGAPITMFMNALTGFLENLSTGSKFVYGAVMGSISGFDFGGPVNKTMSLYSTAMMTEGIYGPKAAHFLAGMTSPFGILVAWCLSKAFKKPIFTNDEKESVKACLPMGVCMITESVIPFAMNDLWRVVLSSVVGSAVGGGLCLIWGVGVPVAHGGLFVVPTFVNPMGFVAALAISSLICGTMIFVLKKRLTEKQIEYGTNYTDAKSDEVAEVNIEF